MQTLAPVPATESMTARELAASYWRANHQSLLQFQPAVATLLDTVELETQWVYARDGSLTGMRPDGRWWADCSVPLLAGRALLKTLEQGSIGSCLLAPQHAGLVRAARERMGPWAVLFVIQPDIQCLRMILTCQDFSDQILQQRIWFTCGNEWPRHLKKLLDTHPGLATPTRFIRTKLTAEEVIGPMIADAQSVFSQVLNDRSEIIAAIKSTPRNGVDPERILHIGGTEFRLWDFAGAAMQDQFTGLKIDRFDTDCALCTSPVALVKAVQNCGSVVAADLFRADSNQLVDPAVPWITWITQPTIPLFEKAGAHDGLVLADANWLGMAEKAGWPRDRVRACGWPTSAIDFGSADSSAVLGFICDTQRIQIPPAVLDFSSHRLLWDLIEEELAGNPLMVEEIDSYLTDRSQQLNIKPDSLDRRAFIENLILPAYQQGLARLLLKASIPISIFGKGWMDLAEFSSCSTGELPDREAFNVAVASCIGLVYCWPTRGAHTIDALGKPIVHRAGQDSAQLIRNAKRVLAGSDRRPPVSYPPNGSLRKAILELLASTVQGSGEIPKAGVSTV